MKKDKNIHGNSADDHLRYSGGEMTPGQRHEFERRLQKDQFEEEAAEGLESVKPDEARKDITSLHREISSRTSVRRIPMIYRYAAAIIVLAVVTTMLVVRDQNNKSMLVADNIEAGEQTGAKGDKPVADMTEVVAPEKELVEPEEKSVVRMEESAVEEIKEEEMADVAEITTRRMAGVTNLRVTDSVIITESDLAVSAIPETIDSLQNIGGVSEPSTPAGRAKTAAAKRDVREEMEQQPEIFALDELVMVTDTSVIKIIKWSPVGLDRTAMPAGGFEALSKYISENTHWPYNYDRSGVEIVRLSFMIGPDGILSAFSIIDTETHYFSEEAVGLIQEGPSWQPSLRDGLPVESKVTMTVTFRK